MNPPNSLQNLLTPSIASLLLPTSDEHMPLFRLTARNLHKLIELQHPPLAACIALAPLMKNRHSRMENALLSLPTLTIILMTACLPSAYLALRNLQTGFVVLGLWWGWWRGSSWLWS